MIRSEIENFLKTLKVHNKELDSCFNDAVAVHHLGALITKSNQELLDRIERELPENPYSESPIPDDPVYSRMYLDKWYGYDDCTDQTKATIDRIKGEL